MAEPQSLSGRVRLSTAQTLSLVTVGVVVAVLATAMAVVWVTLTRSAVELARQGVEHGVRQLANVTATTVRQSQARYSAVAHDSAIVRALRSPVASAKSSAKSSAKTDSVTNALRQLHLPTDSGLPIELWDSTGRRIALTGDDSPSSVQLEVPNEAGVHRAFRPGLDSILPADSLQLGALYRVGQRTMYWIVMPVVIRGRTLGYIAQQRRIATSPQTEKTIRELSGNGASGYYHNVDGTVWTTVGGSPVTPPDLSAGDSPSRPGIGPVISSEARIAGTPIVLRMEAPRQVVVGRVTGTMRRLMLLSVILTLVGAGAAWWAGRRVARPLVHLTTAAEAVARGTYEARVSVAGTEEIARLSSTFNEMAMQIEETRMMLQKARESAESASKAKSDFLAAMSHELRTPLNAIGGYTELMEMGLRGSVSEEQRRDLTRIRTNQRHLLGLVESILDLNRIERGEVTYDRASIGVDPMLLGLEELVFPQAHAKRQRLVYQAVERNLVVIADREKLRQVLLNLLSNAIRHSPTDASIVMTAGRRGPDTIAISVSDSGPGIPLEQQESIFEPFVQLNRSLTNSVEGVGLGLAISRDLARGMGGDLTVASGPGQGSSFTLTLPAGVANEQTQMARTAENLAVPGQ